MNANLYRKVARESRRLGHTFTAVSAIWAAGSIGCLLHRGAGLTIAFAVASIFCGFIAATCFGDAQAAEEAAEEWEQESNHDHIDLP
jgi:hypothetical protein